MTRHGNSWSVGFAHFWESPDSEKPGRFETRPQPSREVAEAIGSCSWAAGEVAEAAGKQLALVVAVVMPWRRIQGK